MANIYVGFHDQRSSSRVLKPPGGGTSDIFGTDALKLKQEEEKSASTTPAKQQNENEEKSDSNSVNNTNEEGQSNSDEPNISNLSIREENGEKSYHSTDEAKAEAKPDSIGSIIRQDENKVAQVQSPVAEAEKKSPQRVPPGGYSSGLW